MFKNRISVEEKVSNKQIIDTITCWTDARCPVPWLWIRCTEFFLGGWGGGGGGGNVVRRMGTQQQLQLLDLMHCITSRGYLDHAYHTRHSGSQVILCSRNIHLT